MGQLLFEAGGFCLAAGLVPFIMMCIAIAGRSNDLCPVSTTELIFGGQNPCDLNGTYSGDLIIKVQDGFQDDVVTYLFDKEPEFTGETVKVSRLIEKTVSCGALSKNKLLYIRGTNVTLNGAASTEVLWIVSFSKEYLWEVREDAIFEKRGMYFDFQYLVNESLPLYVIPYFEDCASAKKIDFRVTVQASIPKYSLVGAKKNFTGKTKTTVSVKKHDFLISTFKETAVKKNDTIIDSMELVNAIKKILALLIAGPILFVICVPLGIGCIIAGICDGC